MLTLSPSSVQRLWLFALGFSGLMLASGVAFALSRNVFSGMISDYLVTMPGVVTAIWAVLSWIGIAAQFNTSARRYLLSFLSHWVGSLVVVSVGVVTGSGLLVLAHRKQNAVVVCRPSQLVASFVNGERRDVCGQRGYFAASDRITAIADGYAVKEIRFGDLRLPPDVARDGEVPVRLLPLERNWRCSRRRQPTPATPEQLAQCGTSPTGNWMSGWAYEARLQGPSALPSGAFLAASSYQYMTVGVALVDPHDENTCPSRAGESKMPPWQDRIYLHGGCRSRQQPTSYDFMVIVCLAQPMGQSDALAAPEFATEIGGSRVPVSCE